MAEKITLHGMQFDRHPTPSRGNCSERARYARLAVALQSARRLCSTQDRALYLSLTRAYADVLFELHRLGRSKVADVLDLPWETRDGAPPSCASDPCPGSV